MSTKRSPEKPLTTAIPSADISSEGDCRMDQKKQPVLFEYLDVFRFLQDYYSYRKASQPRFSYETWATELGIKNKSFLRLAVLRKKKISQKLADALSNLLFAEKTEKDYFYYLVKYSQASDNKEKQDASHYLIRVLRTNTEEELIENYTEFVSTPLLPRLLTLLSFQDLHPVSATFARLLGLEASETELLLGKLEKVKLAEKIVTDGETHWKSTTTAFKVPDQVGSEALLQYHKASLEDAINAFHQPKELRRYKSLLLAMTQEQAQEFYKLLDSFANEQKSRFSSQTLDDKKLFQANFNVHAVCK